MKEQRFHCELRAEANGRRIVGHAAVFNQVAEIGDAFFERIDPAAFDAVLADPQTDVRALLNHDPTLLLGRQSAGTLRLSTDKLGLRFELDLPNTSYASDLRELVARGDLTGASFGFLPGKVARAQTREGRTLITHTSVSGLLDVSPVTFPAYEGAGVALRSRQISVLTDGKRNQLIRARHRARAR